MKVTIEGFRQEIMAKYNLKGNDVIFLRWFTTFRDNGMKKIVDENDDTFYWIKYSKVVNDMPTIFENVFSVKREIKRLLERNVFTPKIKKTMSGTETYFMFNPIILYELENIEMDSLITGKEINNKLKEKPSKKRITLNKNILMIFENIKKIEANGKIIFNHESPVDNTHYTSTYYNFQNTIYDLYEGRFLTNHKIDAMPKWFLEKYKFYLDKEKIIEKIKSCKNNWIEINNLIVNSVKNYSYWFLPDSEVENKSKLPKDINTFIFHPKAEISMFYVCILYKATTAREAFTETTVNNIPSKVLALVNPVLKKENYDSCEFYKKINQLVKWYDKNVNDLCRKDSNCQYWLQTRSGFIENYLEWISDTIGKHPKIGNFGIGNKTFDWYVSDKIKEHSIEIEIPRSNRK